MSKSVYRKIKKQNGERFAKVIRDYHNGIFQVPNIVKIVKHAGCEPEDAEAILPHLMTLLNIDEGVETESKDPWTLLDEAGYEAYHADDQEKQDQISPYFQEGEKLCTFGTRRWESYHIVNAIRKDVAEIRREDFLGKEERDDPYGTSVLSIQMAKKGGFISIKNRYNHTVSGCDNTLNSNPDNIIEGLSKALQEHFGVSFKTSQNLPKHFTLVDGQIFKVEMEENGVYYGQTAYVQNGRLIEVDAAKGEYLFDIYIFNDRDKTFRMIDSSILDSFPEDYNRVYAGKKSVYVKKHCIWDADPGIDRTELKKLGYSEEEIQGYVFNEQGHLQLVGVWDPEDKKELAAQG